MFVFDPFDQSTLAEGGYVATRRRKVEPDCICYLGEARWGSTALYKGHEAQDGAISWLAGNSALGC